MDQSHRHRTTVVAGAGLLLLTLMTACNAPREERTEMGGNAATDTARGSAELLDGHIAHIAMAANTGDSLMGAWARPRAQSTAVREFAALMVRDHGASNNQARELAGRLGLTPVAHDKSRELSDDVTNEQRDLADDSGRDFDHGYIEHEVALHDRVLKALDDDLIPNADNAELRQLLTQARAVVASHLEMARAIERNLGGARDTTKH